MPTQAEVEAAGAVVARHRQCACVETTRGKLACHCRQWAREALEAAEVVRDQAALKAFMDAAG